MPKNSKLIIIGKQYGNLTVLQLAYYKNKHSYWKCRCICGNERIVSISNLYTAWKRQTSKCLCNKEPRNCRSRFYTIWQGMKARCNQKGATEYENYGGRGIKVCERWNEHITGFRSFKQDMHEAYLLHVKTFGEKQTTIDRINGNGNYEPKNCRWATYSVQRLNTRRRCEKWTKKQ